MLLHMKSAILLKGAALQGISLVMMQARTLLLDSSTYKGIEFNSG